MQRLVRLIFILGILLLGAPFVIGSLYVDRHGTELTGRVYSKREDVFLRQGSWTRESEVTFEVQDPDTRSPRFFATNYDGARYDSFHKGDSVRVHYLRRADVPRFPGAQTLWDLHMLPTVRLADEHAFERMRRAFTPPVTLACGAILGLVIVLWIWRRSRFPYFAWALCLCIACAISLLMVYDFPRPTAAPASEVRQAPGKVKSVAHIDRLFSGARSRGLDAHQPIDVLGIEFVPEGRSDSVVAADLIDRDPAHQIVQGMPVTVDYEAAAPRTAQLRGVTRQFLSRNIAGVGIDLGLYVAVLVGGLLVLSLIGKWWSGLMGRRRAAAPADPR